MNDQASPIRILVVDDHPVVRAGVETLVTGQADMTIVAQASNGREAIQQFRSHHPDVTLMDIQMPEMNGLDALIAIRNESPEARIIMLTTYAGDAQVLRAIKAGAQGYLLKSALHRGTARDNPRPSIREKRRSLLRSLRSCRACHRRRPHSGGNSCAAADCARERQQRDCRAAIRKRRDGERSGPKHPVQIGCERPHSRRHDRSETRHHRVVIPSKESLARAVWGLCLDSGVHNLIMSCVDFSQLSPTVRLAWVFSCSEWLRLSPWFFTLRWHSAAVPRLDQPY